MKKAKAKADRVIEAAIKEADELTTTLFELSITAMKTKSANKLHKTQLKAGIIRERLAELNKDKSIKLSN